MSDVPHRLRWFSSILLRRGTERILEVGCGSGLLLELLAHASASATLVGIDRSALQVRKATQRLAPLAHPPRVHHLTLEDAAPALGERFTRIVAMNVNLAWTNPIAAGTALRALLAPRGRVFLGFEPPTPLDARELRAKLASAVGAAGFMPDGSFADSESSAFAVVWRRATRRATRGTA
jgi:2-polyprenyl-3-methyl-5-hydroxy-6-metoxy-1,4-benzoquinol methylase